MENHQHPFNFSPATPRLPPPKAHRRGPSRSPTRNRHSVTDDIFADFAPARIYEAFTNPSGRLKASIEAASPADRAFGLRAAKASKNIQEWVHELQGWDWPDESGSAGFEVPTAKRRRLFQEKIPDKVEEETEYIGSLRASTVSEYESRVKLIRHELEELNVEDIKRHVLDTHFTSGRPPSSASNISTTALSTYTRMEDFTAIVTATVLKSLPNLGRLMCLMDVWSIRLIILRRVPGLLRNFEDSEIAMKSGWSTIQLRNQQDRHHNPHEPQTLSRATFETMRSVLQEKVTKLGRDVDYMLDTLEGQEDTLPDIWLDRMEAIEQDYGEWAVAGDRKVREGEWEVLAKARREREEAARRASEEAARLKAEQDAKEAEAEALRLETQRRAQEAEIARQKAEEDARFARAEAQRLQELRVAEEAATRLETERLQKEREAVKAKCEAEEIKAAQLAISEAVSSQNVEASNLVPEVHTERQIETGEGQARALKVEQSKGDRATELPLTSPTLVKPARSPPDEHKTLEPERLAERSSTPTQEIFNSSTDVANIIPTSHLHNHAPSANNELEQPPSKSENPVEAPVLSQCQGFEELEEQEGNDKHLIAEKSVSEVSLREHPKDIPQSTTRVEQSHKTNGIGLHNAIAEEALFESSSHEQERIPLSNTLVGLPHEMHKTELHDSHTSFREPVEVNDAEPLQPFSSPEVIQNHETDTTDSASQFAPAVASTFPRSQSIQKKIDHAPNPTASFMEEAVGLEKKTDNLHAVDMQPEDNGAFAKPTSISIDRSLALDKHGSGAEGVKDTEVESGLFQDPRTPMGLQSPSALDEESPQHKALKAAEAERAEVARLRALLSFRDQDIPATVKQYFAGQTFDQPNSRDDENSSTLETTLQKSPTLLDEVYDEKSSQYANGRSVTGFDGAYDVQSSEDAAPSSNSPSRSPNFPRLHVGALLGVKSSKHTPNDTKVESSYKTKESNELPRQGLANANQGLQPSSIEDTFLQDSTSGQKPLIDSALHLQSKFSDNQFRDKEHQKPASSSQTPIPTGLGALIVEDTSSTLTHDVLVTERDAPESSDSKVVLSSKSLISPSIQTTPAQPSYDVVYSAETGTFTYVKPLRADETADDLFVNEPSVALTPLYQSGYSTTDATPEILNAEPAHYFRPLMSPIKSARSSVLYDRPNSPASPTLPDISAKRQKSPSPTIPNIPPRSPGRLSSRRQLSASPSPEQNRAGPLPISSVDGAVESTPVREVELVEISSPALARKTSITRINSPGKISLVGRDSASSGSTVVDRALSSPASPRRRPSSPPRPSTPTFASTPESYKEDLSPSIRRHRNGNSHDYTSPDSPPPIPDLTNRSPVSPRAYGSFSTTMESSESPKTPLSTTGSPSLIPIPISPRKGNTDDQMQQQISTLLESIPARIRLTNKKNSSPLDSLNVKKTRRPVGPALRPNSTLSNHSRAPTPSFTLTPAHGSTQPRQRPQNGNPEIKVYHLSRSTGEAPIKLFVRLVGENGERVMVRVGGGWADLGEYLKEYALHHGRRAAVTDDSKVEIQDLPPRTVSGSSTSTLRDNGRSTPTPRPLSAFGRPLSSLALRKTRNSTGGDTLLGAPTTASLRSPSTPLSSSLSRSFGSSSASHDTPPSHPSSIERSSSRMSSSWADEDSSLGLAGPRSKKTVISEKDQEWVESMKEKVRQASAEKERRNRQASLGEMDKVGGTKRLFRKG